MRIARRGYVFILGAALPALLFYVLNMKLLAAPFAAVALFSLWFFRDPERTVPGSHGYVAPADGRVIRVDKVSDGDVGEDAICVSIFMSAFDVHVNRAPEAGTIKETRYHRGRFFIAHTDEAQMHNERNEVVVEREDGARFKFVQVAGAFARRIFFYKTPGDLVKRGERVGLIAFGSRVDLIMPANVEVIVKKGDRVRAGETLVAR